MPLTHVALLRGINVGGKHKLPMKELVFLFEAAGCTEVRTYIQSGNVVFKASGTLAKKVPGLVSAGIRERFGFDAPVVFEVQRGISTCRHVQSISQGGRRGR